LAACSKQDMPQPAATDIAPHRPSATERRTNDTLAKLTILPFGKGPVPAEKDPEIKKP
jgi:hypothetical protein